MEATAVSAPHQGRRHLQRLIRKVKLVLVVKHCLDDLKGGVALRQGRGVHQRTYVHSQLFIVTVIGMQCPIHFELQTMFTLLDETKHRSTMQRDFQLKTSRHTDHSKGLTLSMGCPMDPQHLRGFANLMLLLIHSTAIMQFPRSRLQRTKLGPSPLKISSTKFYHL
jgi:hypothetical protein